ncbi:hypothetical protein EYF80_045578 [Liparis tanakae]|uniref:Secreted protein n=1 Tax=Liparis tanakae TaxID=230148 RepID=A0A4Z2FTV1_9TELE|nr:hypothetical protein EYF80_045578 [Liparis tanakae]
MISSSVILPFFFCLSAALEAASPSGHALGAGMGSITDRNLRTSSTACGFFFCSDLVMLEVWRSRAHCSGMPCEKDGVVSE